MVTVYKQFYTTITLILLYLLNICTTNISKTVSLSYFVLYSNLYNIYTLVRIDVFWPRDRFDD